LCSEPADRVDYREPGAGRALGVVLMRSRVAEIDQDTVAHILGDKAVEPRNDLGDGAMIRADDLAQNLGIEARRELGRADQITEHHRELPPFGIGCRRIAGSSGHGGRHLGAERGNSVEQPPAMPDQRDAEILQILGRQARQYPCVDLVVAEGRHIALKAQTL
jgi:hypothetical protein